MIPLLCPESPAFPFSFPFPFSFSFPFPAFFPPPLLPFPPSSPSLPTVLELSREDEFGDKVGLPDDDGGGGDDLLARTGMVLPASAPPLCSSTSRDDPHPIFTAFSLETNNPLETNNRPFPKPTSPTNATEERLAKAPKKIISANAMNE